MKQHTTKSYKALLTAEENSGLEIKSSFLHYARMIALPDGEEKEAVKNSLLEYCKLDTLAMVEIHRVLAN